MPSALWHTRGWKTTEQSPDCSEGECAKGFRFPTRHRAPISFTSRNSEAVSYKLFCSFQLQLLATKPQDENFRLELNTFIPLHCASTASCTPCWYQSILLLPIGITSWFCFGFWWVGCFFNPYFSRAGVCVCGIKRERI